MNSISFYCQLAFSARAHNCVLAPLPVEWLRVSESRAALEHRGGSSVSAQPPRSDYVILMDTHDVKNLDVNKDSQRRPNIFWFFFPLDNADLSVYVPIEFYNKSSDFFPLIVAIYWWRLKRQRQWEASVICTINLSGGWLWWDAWLTGRETLLRVS